MEGGREGGREREKEEKKEERKRFFCRTPATAGLTACDNWEISQAHSRLPHSLARFPGTVLCLVATCAASGFCSLPVSSEFLAPYMEMI